MNTITVFTKPKVYLQRRAMRPLRDVTEYTVYDGGRVQIKVTSKTEVERLVRRRYGKGVLIEYRAWAHLEGN